MNTYKIAYQFQDGKPENIRIVERNEQAARVAARRRLKEMYDGAPQTKDTITSIELIQENVTATKQQERDTLAAIRKLVEELGPDSYLKAAFEGCFEDAENNIEDDAAYSMKDRYEDTEAQLKAAQAKIKELKKGYEEGCAEWSEAASIVKTLRECILSADDLTDISQLLAGKVLDLGKEISNAAERIVEGAAQPESAAFQNAVKDHRAAKVDLEYYTALLVRVNNIAKAGA